MVTGTAFTLAGLPGDLVNILALSARMAAGIALFAWHLPHRARFGRRAAALALLWAACVTAFVAAGLNVAQPSPVESALVQLAIFSAVLLACVGAVSVLFETSVWVALFCSTAGYTVQNLASGIGELALALLPLAGVDASSPWVALATWVVTAVATFVPCHLLVARKIDQEGLSQVEDRSMLAMMAVVSLVVIGFDLTIKLLAEVGLRVGFVVVLRLFHALACVFTLSMEYVLLYRRHLEQDMAATERLLAERERQYQMSRENIEAINVKCHDIKHQIRTLAGGGAAVDARVLDDIEREVSVYDSSVKTGNEALDTILTEKGLLCERRGITLTCIADGSALAGMAPADLYALFGNALDNAIEAVIGLDDPTRRSITLSVRSVVGVAAIHVENYCDDTLVMGADGLPVTTKGDRANHGFGTRSMRQIAERYGGSFSAVAEGGAFKLDVMIPLTYGHR
ncbi:MAG TPA: GHKL domain-containing protein [Candidatus Olsenella pullicola]|nr:GHKL domain-containing protein [Candidatus Olsenella pullicola]